MTALQVIDKNVLTDTLLSLSAITDLVGDGQTPIAYKIYWEHVPQETELPYITLHHIMGGRDKNKAYSDTTWKIVGHTANIITAQSLANAISQLDHLDPVTTAYPDVCGFIYIEEYMPIFDRYQVANTPLIMVGGLYRLRLNLVSN